eukprot:scaffold67827_cov71-Phaeocystis_antarctica.AAC.6
MSYRCREPLTSRSISRRSITCNAHDPTSCCPRRRTCKDPCRVQGTNSARRLGGERPAHTRKGAALLAKSLRDEHKGLPRVVWQTFETGPASGHLCAPVAPKGVTAL